MPLYFIKVLEIDLVNPHVKIQFENYFTCITFNISIIVCKMYVNKKPALYNGFVKCWLSTWRRWDSNPRPLDCQSSTLAN